MIWKCKPTLKEHWLAFNHAKLDNFIMLIAAVNLTQSTKATKHTVLLTIEKTAQNIASLKK